MNASRYSFYYGATLEIRGRDNTNSAGLKLHFTVLYKYNPLQAIQGGE
jgi:hypothetical protein